MAMMVLIWEGMLMGQVAARTRFIGRAPVKAIHRSCWKAGSVAGNLRLPGKAVLGSLRLAYPKG